MVQTDLLAAGIDLDFEKGSFPRAAAVRIFKVITTLLPGSNIDFENFVAAQPQLVVMLLKSIDLQRREFTVIGKMYSLEGSTSIGRTNFVLNSESPSSTESSFFSTTISGFLVASTVGVLLID
jgi:hypothetical protein